MTPGARLGLCPSGEHIFKALLDDTIRINMNRIMAATTTLGFALLGLLHKEARSGYDLRKIFQTTPMGHYSSSPGAIYPALRRLGQRGLITGSVDRSQPLRPRKMFQPTRLGTKALKEWLARPITGDDVVFRLDELLLRFAFMEHLDSPEATRQFLRSLVRELESYVKELELHHQALPQAPTPHGALALQCGIESHRAHLRWARSALKHFQSGKKRRRVSAQRDSQEKSSQ